MSFVSIAEASISLNLPMGILHDMCEHGLIDGAVRFGRIWAVPENLHSSELSAICRD